jgi:cytidylate kinase
MMISIRGANTVQENTKEAILDSTKELLQEIIHANELQASQIISVFFTATKDLTKVYPAVAARDLGLTECSLICCQEMYVEDSLKQCIRVLFHVNVTKEQKDIQHIYLGGAKVLRPDIAKPLSIAIDGPAGAGKSTIAKALAQKLNFIYVDTGAMYRALGYYIYHQINDDIYDKEKLSQYIQNYIDQIHVSIDYEDGQQQIFVCDENVTSNIRTQEIGHIASIISANKYVRLFLVKEQQNLAKVKSVVMDGRDIGTHVLPDAPLKIFLTASVEIRALRRFNELNEKGQNPHLQTIQEEIEERDYRDMHREFAPLEQAGDAIVVDTSDMSIDEVVKSIYERAKKLGL